MSCRCRIGTTLRYVPPFTLLEKSAADSVRYQFIFERLNRIPAEARGADFSRIKPWYLDSRATHLRQTVLLSAFSTPDTRALFRSLTNVAGKQQWETGAAHVEGVLDQVQVGVKQVWHRFESEGIETEEDERWTWFREETLTGLMRSAVASSSGTLIFVPSYYDFVRMADHLGKIAGLEFASISECAGVSSSSCILELTQRAQSDTRPMPRYPERGRLSSTAKYPCWS